MPNESELIPDAVQPGQRFAAPQQFEIGAHRRRRSVAVLGIVSAGAGNDGVEFHQSFAVGQLAQLRGQLGKFLAVFSCRDFVEHFAETVEIGLRRAGTFRRGETFGAHIRASGIHACDQSDVRQLGDAIHENCVGRLYVAVNQPVSMQMFQRRRQREADANAFLELDPSTKENVALQCARMIILRDNLAARDLIVGQFHDVIEAIVTAPDVQNVHLTFMRPGNRFKAAYAIELALERAVVIE